MQSVQCVPAFNWLYSANRQEKQLCVILHMIGEIDIAHDFDTDLTPVSHFKRFLQGSCLQNRAVSWGLHNLGSWKSDPFKLSSCTTFVLNLRQRCLIHIYNELKWSIGSPPPRSNLKVICYLINRWSLMSRFWACPFQFVKPQFCWITILISSFRCQ